MATESLSNQTLSSISGDRAAEFLRGDDSQTTPRAGSRRDEQRQVTAVNPNAAVEDLLKFYAAADAPGPVKTPGQHDG
jgi:hypothetical protein